MKLRIPRFQISLRMLVAFTAVCAVGSFFIRQYVLERHAEEQLTKNGLVISFLRPHHIGGGPSFYWGPEYEKSQKIKTSWDSVNWELHEHVRQVVVNTMPGSKRFEINDSSLAPIRNLRHVEVLSLHGATITDEGFDHFCHLQTLRSLGLTGGAKLTPNGFQKLTDFGELEALIIENSNLSDCNLNLLTRMPKLRVLALLNGQIQGPALASIAALPNLEELRLTGNPLKSEDLRHLVNLKNLRVLDLGRTEIDNQAAAYIVKLTSLEVLSVGQTKVDDEFIETISFLDHLRQLDIQSTRVTNKSEALIKSLPDLVSFQAWETFIDSETKERIEEVTRKNQDRQIEEEIAKSTN